jgi:hypothetical protein
MSADRPDEAAVDRLEPSGRPPGRSRRRTAIVGIAAAAVLGVGGAGAWGLAQFLDGGTPAAAAVPQDALAYVSVDLDPDGGQKLEVARTLRKFPAIKEQVGSGDDLRRWIFDAVTKQAPCDDLDFADDIDPWLGNKMAFAVLPAADGTDPVPMAAVEVKDEDAAEAGVAKLAECGTESADSADGADSADSADGADEAAGLAFVEGFMVLAETDEVADDVVRRVQSGSLVDDAGFTRWVEEAGGSGIVTGYVSADAPTTVVDLIEGGLDGTAGGLDGADGATPFGSPEELAEAFEEFEGGAMSLRFDDGALEVELAGGGAPSDLTGDGSSGIADLPATTALALGLTVSDTAAQELVDSLTESMGEKEAEQLLATAEQMSGLSLPEDLQTLLGDGLSVAVDGSIDLPSVFSGGDPTTIPAGVRIVGDPAEIVPLLEKVATSAGVEGQVAIESGDGVVAFGLDADYVGSLAADGGLGDESGFRSAMPDLDDRAGGIYLDFDAGDWLTELAQGDADARENLEPLASLGITSWQDGDVVHGKIRLATD